MATDTERRRLINLPPELMLALGAVCVRAGQIEHILALTIHRTMRNSYDEAIAEVDALKHRKKISKKARKSFRDRTIQDFGNEQGNEYADLFDGLVAEWYALAKRRDQVIHCCWTVGSTDEPPVGTRTRTGEALVWDDRVVVIEDVEKLAADLKDLVIRLNMATKSGEAKGDETVTANADLYITAAHDMETTATAAFSPSPSPGGLGIVPKRTND